jgi:hypothetical protein
MHLLDLFSLLQGFSGLKPPLLLDCLLAGFSFRTDFFADFLLASFVRAVSDIDPYTSLRKDAPSILGSPVNPLLAFLPTFCIFFASMGLTAAYTSSSPGFRLYVIAHTVPTHSLLACCTQKKKSKWKQIRNQAVMINAATTLSTLTAKKPTTIESFRRRRVIETGV